MRCVHHSAFWFAVFGSSLLGLATILPLWLGRITGESFRFYSLWYQLICRNNSCTSLDYLFKNENVEGSFGFELIALPVSALIAALCAFLGVILMEILSCDYGRRAGCNPRPVVVFCTVLFWITALFSALALFLSVAVCIEFYNNDGIQHAAEFPWCTLLFAIGLILIIVSAILFTIIICNWDVYGLFYGYRGDDWESLEDVDNVNSTSYKKTASVRDRSKYSESIKRSDRESKKVPVLGGVSSFTERGSNGVGIRRSDNGNSRQGTNDTYFDFRLGSSKKKSGFTDPKTARKTIHDNPAFLQNTTASEFIQDERNSIRESRKIPRPSSSETIEQQRSRTSHASRPRDSDTSRSGSRSLHSQPSDPNISNILYKESKKIKSDSKKL